MNISDLKPGDVLLFSPEKGSWISEAIVLLTGAPVSHGAIAYNPSTSLIESTPPVVRVATCATRFPGRTIHVRRLESASNFEPVLAAATGYLQEGDPYPMQELYVLGTVMLFSKFIPDGITGDLMIKVFTTLAESIVDYVNKHEYPGKQPMVCSQFVYQSFVDGGYELKINDRLVGAAAAQQAVALIDRAMAHTPTLAAATTPDGHLLNSVHRFAAAVHLASPSAPPVGDAQKGLQLLNDQRAMFVSPADLLRSPSLTDVGIIQMPGTQPQITA